MIRNLGRLRQRLLLGAGIVLLVAGVAILAIGLISYFDDDTPATDPSLTQLEPGDIPPPDGIEDIPGLPVAIPFNNPERPAPPTAPLRLVIEAIGVDAPVIEMGMSAEGVPYVPLNGQDVAWYNFSALPGAGSNAVFAGHINWERAPGVFGDLDQLAAGDKVSLVSDDGREYTYEVFDNVLVDPNDPNSLKVMAATDTDQVTLITCGGSWVPDSAEQFGGDYTGRTVVKAKLVRSAVSAGGD
jgi:LPXTG-site transpeptidase (sortase) family protein